ncbi:hypothetical protein [Paracoccus sp. (in: a-proteobacteria)]|nr:hypothetical protein [Paracoccus sp. (in: a-proteobacteria)]
MSNLMMEAQMTREFISDLIGGTALVATSITVFWLPALLAG